MRTNSFEVFGPLTPWGRLLIRDQPSSRRYLSRRQPGPDLVATMLHRLVQRGVGRWRRQIENWGVK